VQLVVGRATKRLTHAGTTTVVARLGSTARRGLAHRRSVTLWVEITVTDAAGNRSRTTRRAVVVRAKRAARRH
jgi:hypothetical protein